MFNRILISVPQEQFPQMALERGKDLAERLDSKIYLSYIIEDDVFDEVSDRIRHVVTEKESENFQKKMTRTHEKVAKKIILKEAERILGEELDEFIVQKGNYSRALLDSIDYHDADTLLMEYESFNLMKYRIMDISPVPVWIERHEGDIKKIGLFCTNLSPNRMAPRAARKLQKALNAKVQGYYVNDPAGDTDEDEPGEISDLFRIKWEDVVNEKVDRFIFSRAKEEEFDLIILGRIRKRGYFHLRSRFAKRTNCSVLLMN